MVAVSIDWGPGNDQRLYCSSAVEPLVIPRTKGQMFQSIAPETIK
jgi:hypothetical protein